MSLWRIGLAIAAAHAQCVTKQTISPGDGVTFPRAGDSVSIHYTGTLTSGTKFDSSRDRGKEFTTQIGQGQVIQGWDEGVPQLSLGERATLRISAACGYGARGSPPVIPPNADLVFDVELLGINGRRAGTSFSTPAASFALPSASFSTLPATTSSVPSASFSTFASTLPSSAFASTAASSFTSTLPSASLGSGFKSSSSSLPSCIKSSCGHAISFDPNGNSRPLCLCNPICQEMAGTPGVLPCCPKLQEICLDPYRSPSPRPPVNTMSQTTFPAVSASTAATASTSVAATASTSIASTASASIASPARFSSTTFSAPQAQFATGLQFSSAPLQQFSQFSQPQFSSQFSQSQFSQPQFSQSQFSQTQSTQFSQPQFSQFSQPQFSQFSQFSQLPASRPAQSFAYP